VPVVELQAPLACLLCAFVACFLFRQKTSSAGSHSYTSFVKERRNVERSLASKRRCLLQLKKGDIVNSITDDIKPTFDMKTKQVLRNAQIRGPGRARGFSRHQRISRFPPLPIYSDVHSASSFEVSVEELEKAEKVRVEDGQASAASSSEDLNHQFIMNGGHDYFQTLNDDKLTERWTAIDAGSIQHRPLNLFNYTLTESSDDERSTGNWANVVDSCYVNGAIPSCTRDLLLSAIEIDHAYAKRVPVLEQLREPRRCVVDSSDKVLARLTIFNTRSSGLPYHHYVPSVPCVQKCTVTLNKLDDAVFTQQPRIKFQLRQLKQHSSIDEHFTLEDSRCSGNVLSAASNGYLSSSSDGLNASLYSSSAFVRPVDSAFPVPGCRDGMPASTSSHNSGLELLASVSSLTADRLQETSWPANGSCADVSSVAASDSICRQTSHVTPDTSKRRINMFCIRKKCSTDGSISEANGPTSAQLLNVVRDFIAKGSSGPLCGTFPSRLERPGARRGQAMCTRRSEEIACNSLLYLHNCHSPLYNGLTELR